MKPKLTIKPLIFICGVALNACAGTGAVVEYYPVQSNRTPIVTKTSPKSVTWYKGVVPADKPGVTVIGTSRVFVSNRMDGVRVISQLKEVAAQHGANAVFTHFTNGQRSLVPYNISPVVMDMPQTSYTNTSSQIYSPYSGYVGSINTTGTTTTNVIQALPSGGMAGRF